MVGVVRINNETGEVHYFDTIETQRHVMLAGPDDPADPSLSVAFVYNRTLVVGKCLYVYDADKPVVYMAPAHAQHCAERQFRPALAAAVIACLRQANVYLEDDFFEFNFAPPPEPIGASAGR